MQEISKKDWGFDIKTIDKTASPQDDFYNYANGDWLKKNKIPPTESRWGSFIVLRHDTEHQLRDLVNEVSKKKKLVHGTPEQLVRDMFRSGMDVKGREKLGITPLTSLRSKIENIRDRESLIGYLAETQKLGLSLPWGVAVDQDSKNSKKYTLYFFQGGIGMPDRDYYLKKNPEFTRIKTAYESYIEKIFRLIGYSASAAVEARQSVMRTETRLAKASMDKVDSHDPQKTYHKKTLRELVRFAPAVNWKKYFSQAGIPHIPYVVINHLDFIKESQRLIKTLSIKDWKIYLEWQLAEGAAPFLTKAFREASFDYYGRALTGSKEMKPDWRRALGTVNGTLGEALGKMYIKKYFNPQTKRKMDTLVSDLFKAYRQRMEKLQWMTSTTKKRAIKKLGMIARKIAYPTRFKSYARLEINPHDYLGNVLRASAYAHCREMRKLTKPVDRGEWFMSPQTVNAYCNFNMNDICFPAAILQPPFFNFYADDAVNYAAIGSVIGHEMTHAFDDKGAQYDGSGNLKNWWSKRDEKEFKKKGKTLVDQFNSYKVSKDVSVNGKLTLGENIADLGGLVIAFDAYQTRLKKTGRKNIGGFTPEERFFFGFAQQERELAREEFMKTAALSDPHSPAKFRINGPLSNFEEFYKTFGVTPKNKLYRKPQHRAEIW